MTLVLAVFMLIATAYLNPKRILSDRSRPLPVKAHRIMQVLVLLAGGIGACATYALLIWSYDIKGQ
jgi:hypothetical protein